MATIVQGALTTTATTADQEIVSNTPSSSVSFKSTVVGGFLTTYSGTESNMGVTKMQKGGVDASPEIRIQNTDLDSVAGVVVIPWGNGLQFSGSEVIRWIVTPAAATSMRWSAAFFGQ
jgi:hypothetical protein